PVQTHVQGRAATSPPITATGGNPTLTVSATTAPPNSPITATLANGPGGSKDWLGLAAVGAPDISFIQWVYVGAGVTNRTWTVNMPATPGQYEFRFFLNDVYHGAAKSPPVTVANSRCG